MRGAIYTRQGDSSVLELVERPIPEPAAGELRIRVVVSGVNPTDWKSRSGAFGGPLERETVPNHDGSGVVDQIGPGVEGFSVGDRVWCHARRLRPPAPGRGELRPRRHRHPGCHRAPGLDRRRGRSGPASAGQIRSIAPDGVDLVVEVAAGADAALDLAVLRPRGTISVYADNGGAALNMEIGRNMRLNARYQFVLLYTVGWDRIAAAAEDIDNAIEAGALDVGEQSGLPLHHSPLEDTAAAHRAVENETTGKVLITVGDEHR